MAWQRVSDYSLGYNIIEKQFYFYYTLVGENVTHQIFPSAQDFLALADMFRHEHTISFNSTGSYFSSDPEHVG